MSKLQDLTGQRFGRLTVISRAENTKNGSSRWVCRCDCGNVIVTQGGNLKTGASKSCGCLSRDILMNRNIKHGGAGRSHHERLYRVWRGIIDRCYYASNNSYRWYGARGIGVCDEWRNNYESFRDWAMANGYDESAPRGQCTIDRIDVNGNYCPENCRWVTMAEQNKNRRAG